VSLITLVLIAFLAVIIAFLAMILYATWRQVDEEWDAERARRGG
jgi:hypothetical protein